MTRRAAAQGGGARGGARAGGAVVVEFPGGIGLGPEDCRAVEAFVAARCGLRLVQATAGDGGVFALLHPVWPGAPEGLPPITLTRERGRVRAMAEDGGVVAEAWTMEGLLGPLGRCLPGAPRGE